MKKRVDKKKKAYLQCAERLSSCRKKNADKLAEKIKKALLELNFLDVQFEINVSEKEHYTAKGIDDVEFLISTNPGEMFLSLGKVA